MSTLPRISLITPSYQQAEYLKECLRSVHDQQYPDLDHLVADGGSTDGSAEVIAAYADRLSWWCSEKDKGQSDALNKGLQRATGEIFGWLNSDDLMLPGSLAHIGRVFAEDPGLVIYEGQRIILHADGSRVPARHNDPHDRIALFTRPCINQQSTFFRMAAVREVGGVDTTLHHIMDLELWWRILFTYGTGNIKVDDVPIAEFRIHEDSKTGQGLEPFIGEQASVLHGMCLLNGEKELASVLASGHDIRTSLRSMDASMGQVDLVRRMTLTFLIKWHRNIFTERQFRMMKLLRGSISNEMLLQVTDAGTIDELDHQLSAGSWPVFRARRKWKHLFG